MKCLEYAKRKIRKVIARSKVPEDPVHAENVLEWVLKLKPDASEALQLAALAHDIDRADEIRKTRRGDFNDYDAFKVAHAVNGAKMLREILESCSLESSLVEEACRLVVQHEFGGDPVSDLLKDADSISYFEVNLPLYYQREGYEETLRRCVWGYHRLSPTMRTMCKMLSFPDPTLSQLVREALAIAETEQMEG